MISDSFSNFVPYVTSFICSKLCFLSFLQFNNLGYSERNGDIFKCLHLKWLWKSCCCNKSLWNIHVGFQLLPIFGWTEVGMLKIVTGWQWCIKCYLLVFNCERCRLLLKRKHFSFLGGTTYIIDYVQVVNLFFWAAIFIFFSGSCESKF